MLLKNFVLGLTSSEFYFVRDSAGLIILPKRLAVNLFGYGEDFSSSNEGGFSSLNVCMRLKLA